MSRYLIQAEELYAAIQLLLGDIEQFKSAIALLAVHSAIAYNDAVSERLGIGISKGSNHMIAYEKTRKECAERKIDQGGLQHLKSLLADKSGYSYRGAVDVKAAQAAAEKAERFQLWAYKNILKRKADHA